MVSLEASPEPEPDLIPISHLALDLVAAPAEGWASYLAGHGISIVFDDLGRRAVSREDARALFEQQRRDEIRKQDQAARVEAEAIARDRAWRARSLKAFLGTRCRGILVDRRRVQCWRRLRMRGRGVLRLMGSGCSVIPMR